MKFVSRPHPSILVQYEGRWELWQWKDKKWGCQILADPSTASIPDDCIAVLPTQTVYSLPLKLKCRDVAQIPRLLPFQIEAKGIHSKNGDVLSYEYQIVKKDDLDATVFCVVAGEGMPGFYRNPRFRTFQVFPHLFRMAIDSITLWREEKRYCVAVMRENVLAHFQTLTSESLDADLCAELRCLSWPLLEIDMFPVTPKVVIWSQENVPVEDLQKNLGWPVSVVSRPEPSLPQSPWNLMPPSLRSLKKDATKKRNIVFIAGGAVALYFAVMAVLAAHIMWTSYSTKALREELVKLEPYVQQVQRSTAQWQKYDIVLNTQLSPLNHIAEATQALPQTGVRLTSFNQDGYDLVIEGEAQNVSRAVAYLEKLKTMQSFKGYQWDSPQPQLSPSGIAKFKFRATNPYASPQKK